MTDFFDDDEEETAWTRTKRKVKAEPFIPLGCLVTVGFLTGGLRTMATQQGHKAQFWMRGRVITQALTIVAIGYGYYKSKNLPPQREVTPTDLFMQLEKQPNRWAKEDMVYARQSPVAAEALRQAQDIAAAGRQQAAVSTLQKMITAEAAKSTANKDL